MLALPLCSPVFPANNTVFQRFRKEDVQKQRVLPYFRQKDAGSPSQQKSRQEESSLGPLFCDTGSPKTTFSGTSSNCCAALGGGAPPPPKYETSGGGGVRGGGYPLSSLRCPTRRAMSADMVYFPCCSYRESITIGNISAPRELKGSIVTSNKEGKVICEIDGWVLGACSLGCWCRCCWGVLFVWGRCSRCIFPSLTAGC